MTAGDPSRAVDVVGLGTNALDLLGVIEGCPEPDTKSPLLEFGRGEACALDSSGRPIQCSRRSPLIQGLIEAREELKAGLAQPYGWGVIRANRVELLDVGPLDARS